MSKSIIPHLFILLILLILSAQAGSARADIADMLQAQSYVLMDAATGQILVEREMHAVRRPASITKIMTTLLALEKCPPDDPVTISRAAVDANPPDGSNAGLQPGEVVPLEEALYAVMLESANEAANAVAEHIGGSAEDFALLMTERAKELGARNTNFANPNGLPNDAHYTTAYDMALITQEAIKNDRFLAIWGAYQHFLEPTNLHSERRTLSNKNRMLSQGSMPYKGILGGKTGFTEASQYTLVEAARRGDVTLICVLMYGPGSMDNFQDAIKLFDYGFDQFRYVTYKDDAYENACTFLLHQSLDLSQVQADYMEPVNNEDGSVSVSVAFEAPEGSGNLMYRHIANVTLTSFKPQPAGAAFSAERAEAFLSTLWRIPPFSWAAGLLSLIAALFGGLIGLIDKLPGFLAFLVKAILCLFTALFILACIFRTRRRIRRRKRMLMKQQREEAARRKAYRPGRVK